MVLSTSLMVALLAILTEGALLLLLRRLLARQIIFSSRWLFHNNETGIWWYSIVTLPGILTHEIAHFLMAALLGIRTGSIEMLPRLSADGSVELGSVQVGTADPIRQSLVGAAPLLFGLPLVVWLSSFLSPPTFPYHFIWTDLLFLYLLISISLHLFPSGKDMTSWPFVGLLLVVAISLISIIGVTIPVTQSALAIVSPWATRLAVGLGIAVLIVGGLVMMSKILNQVIRSSVGVQ